jgi:hypothetical protein
MDRKTAIVVTSISAPNVALRALAKGSTERGWSFLVVGDSKSPQAFEVAGCTFYSLAEQRKLGFVFGEACPEQRYSRKNIGYLAAMRAGAELIIETDDDNIPGTDFWRERVPDVEGALALKAGWVNVYRYFSDAQIYPRGFPIEFVAVSAQKGEFLARASRVCPIQQGLADGDPDVDAIYRMLFSLPVTFGKGAPVILEPGAWCPFNSQNTAFFRDAFPLLYLPTHCSFRMTDIWRGFVAQRILWTCGWRVSFHAADVVQERNEHNLLRDFKEEIPGYLNNATICRRLADLKLGEGCLRIPENLRRCYEMLVEGGFVANEELSLLDAWLSDLNALGKISKA